ncbi:MAG TPA: SpoIVB peptidase S55 domain-containing protein, partial [Thermoanaerobaculia bacterium]|nr:SpoIVB peptidase S55 domain-containing protein [Thermoanaerobaculia bacterium]
FSVFSGRQPERFEVEVLGVMRNPSPDVSYVLARLSGMGLEESGVVAGMSGSPVYVDGKLVGAVAFSWPFAKEAIAGITPIGAMRALAESPRMAPAAAEVAGLAGLLPTRAWEVAAGLGLPAAVAPAPWSVAAPDGSTLEPRARLAAELSRLRPLMAGQGAGAVGWSSAGFGAGTQELLARGLGAVMPAGEALPGGVWAELQPGAAVAAVLVDGDLRLAATGTVTDRRGDEVLAFGHPFLGLGSIAVPMAEAEVVTVVANELSSFKVANFGRTVGAFVDDRLAGIRGTVGAEAATLPLTLRVDAGQRREYQVRVARVPQLTPVLLAVSLLGAQEAAAQSAGTLGLDLAARFDLGELGSLDLARSFDGQNAALQAALYLLAYANFFVNNGFAEVPLEGIEVEVSHHAQPRTATVIGGYAERSRVKPGEDVRLHLDLVPYRGEPRRRELALTVPRDLPAGRYSLLVGDGVSLDAVRQLIEPAAPVRIGQALRLIRGFHSQRDLVVLGVHSGQGLSVGGEVMPSLPGSVQSVWSAASSGSAVPLRLTVAQEHVERSDIPLEGAVRIDLEVVRSEPLAAAEAGGAGGDAAAEEGAEAAVSPAATPAPAAAAEGEPQPEGGSRR